YRFFKAFLRGSFEGSLNTPKMRIADADGIRQMTEQLGREGAAKGEPVSVGRGSAYYLHDRPDAFHVFIYAPFEEKVRRLQLDGKTQEEAIQLGESVDRDRAAFIEEYFDVVWPARHFFDLMINSTLGEEVTAQVIVESLRVVQDSKTGPLKPQ